MKTTRFIVIPSAAGSERNFRVLYLYVHIYIDALLSVIVKQHLIVNQDPCNTLLLPEPVGSIRVPNEDSYCCNIRSTYPVHDLAVFHSPTPLAKELLLYCSYHSFRIRIPLRVCKWLISFQIGTGLHKTE